MAIWVAAGTRLSRLSMSFQRLCRSVAAADKMIDARDADDVFARSFGNRENEMPADAVDDAVGKARGDDFAAQLVLADRVRVFFPQKFREIIQQVLVQEGIVRQVRGHQLLVQPYFCVSHENGKLGPSQALAKTAALGDVGFAWQKLDRAV